MNIHCKTDEWWSVSVPEFSDLDTAVISKIS